MPTKKPRLQTIVEQETYDKIKVLCENETRSESQMLNYIIKSYLAAYEQEHGEIILKMCTSKAEN